MTDEQVEKEALEAGWQLHPVCPCSPPGGAGFVCEPHRRLVESVKSIVERARGEAVRETVEGVREKFDKLGDELASLTSPMRTRDVSPVWAAFWELSEMVLGDNAEPPALSWPSQAAFPDDESGRLSARAQSCVRALAPPTDGGGE